MELNNNIVRFRKEKGLTQEQLANLLNVSVSAVSKWELGNNRPDLELLPDLAEIFQISIDSLLGYEKSYKNLDKSIREVRIFLEEEKYDAAIEEAHAVLQRYPNDVRMNKLMADAYYSLCFSVNSDEGKKENADKAVYYYERSIELFDERYIDGTKENLYCNIASLYALGAMGMYEDAIAIWEKYNGNGKYDHEIARSLFTAGRKEEAKKKALKHCLGQQVFALSDLSLLGDMYKEEGEYEAAILFYEAEIKLFGLFLQDKGSYADRAYAGKAYIISELYRKLDRQKEAAEWHEKARTHAEAYRKNPTMLLSSMKYCGELEGRMIDSFGVILDKLSCNRGII